MSQFTIEFAPSCTVEMSFLARSTCSSSTINLRIRLPCTKKAMNSKRFLWNVRCCDAAVYLEEDNTFSPTWPTQWTVIIILSCFRLVPHTCKISVTYAKLRKTTLHMFLYNYYSLRKKKRQWQKDVYLCTTKYQRMIQVNNPKQFLTS